MADFKEFCEELPSLTQKVMLATESIRFAELTEGEKTKALRQLFHLKDAAEAIIQQLQQDTNKKADVQKQTPMKASGKTAVFCDNMSDAIIDELLRLYST